MQFKKQKRIIHDLENQLITSNQRLEKALKSLGSIHSKEILDEYKESENENLKIQRKLAKIKKLEVAIPTKNFPEWDVGYPRPHVFSSGEKTILLYYTKSEDYEWDGSFVKVISNENSKESELAIIEFIKCYSFKFGGPNDEVFEGHSLWGKGLDAYKAHIVENSQWISNEIKTNKIHRNFNEKYWENINHYLLLFHDSIFECLAVDFNVSLKKGIYEDIIKEAFENILQE